MTKIPFILLVFCEENGYHIANDPEELTLVLKWDRRQKKSKVGLLYMTVF